MRRSTSALPRSVGVAMHCPGLWPGDRSGGGFLPDSGSRSGGRLVGDADLVVGAGLPEGPFGADVAGGPEQEREVVAEEFLAARFRGVDGDVHGGADRSGAVAD